MPIYEYQCDCGKEEERILPIEKCNQPQICVCKRVMLRKVSVSSFTMKQTGNQMALNTLNSKESGMPQKRWTAQAERYAAAGLD